MSQYLVLERVGQEATTPQESNAIAGGNAPGNVARIDCDPERDHTVPQRRDPVRVGRILTAGRGRCPWLLYWTAFSVLTLTQMLLIAQQRQKQG